MKLWVNIATCPTPNSLYVSAILSLSPPRFRVPLGAQTALSTARFAPIIQSRIRHAGENTAWSAIRDLRVRHGVCQCFGSKGGSEPARCFPELISRDLRLQPAVREHTCMGRSRLRAGWRFHRNLGSARSASSFSALFLTPLSGSSPLSFSRTPICPRANASAAAVFLTSPALPLSPSPSTSDAC